MSRRFRIIADPYYTLWIAFIANLAIILYNVIVLKNVRNTISYGVPITIIKGGFLYVLGNPAVPGGPTIIHVAVFLGMWCLYTAYLAILGTTPIKVYQEISKAFVKGSHNTPIAWITHKILTLAGFK